MKRKIRRCVWETNSSMSHSLIIMTEEQEEKWKSGLYYYDFEYWNPFRDIPKEKQPVKGQFYTQDEVLNFLELIGYKYNAEEWEDDGGVEQFIYECDDDFKSYEQWHESDWEEYGDRTYVTPSGEKLMIEWKCGRDG